MLLLRLTCLAIVAVALLSLAWRSRVPLLRGLAESWSVTDQLAPADAIALLGGGDPVRTSAAALQYQRGWAPRILIDLDQNREALMQLNVPERAIVEFGSGLRNTYEESCALAQWAQAHDARRIIVPMEVFPSRRVKWILSRELEQFGTTVLLDRVSVPQYTLANWWLAFGGRSQFRTELAKYGYYRVRYSLDRC